MKGWICPRCDAVNAPTVTQCPCSVAATPARPLTFPEGGTITFPYPQPQPIVPRTWPVTPSIQPPYVWETTIWVGV